MTLLAIALNGLLVVLLLGALAFGWRLERRLKTLKDSHEGFAKAVADLDAAAARAEQGLAALRIAADEAAETLGERIDTARALAGRLERGMTPAADSPVIGHDGERPLGRVSNQAMRGPPIEKPRSRAMVDDDLFEGEPSLRTIKGGRR